ncbi:MAG TPA: hypothetical protein VMF51_24715 [Nocardioides sp.]|uniref:hypothetical protein n=1 Tax=Nocardioides sp. TaxID=35761 RepID=UPI002B9A994F|nr:hypothetical protein [Nocardioides sp.]HTW18350.1 hypothetical protein [Nocardioides sp.]
MTFSWTGLALAAAILLPNALVVLLPPREGLRVLASTGPVPGVVERIGQVGCSTAAVLWGPDRGAAPWGWTMLAAVIAYAALWVRYVLGGRRAGSLLSPVWGVPVPMAVLPVVAFGCGAVWSASPWLAAATAVLAVGHLPNSLRTGRLLRADPARTGGVSPDGRR